MLIQHGINYILPENFFVRPGFDSDLYYYLVQETGFERAINHPALNLNNQDKKLIREFIKLNNI